MSVAEPVLLPFTKLLTVAEPLAMLEAVAAGTLEGCAVGTTVDPEAVAVRLEAPLALLEPVDDAVAELVPPPALPLLCTEGVLVTAPEGTALCTPLKDAAVLARAVMDAQGLAAGVPVPLAGALACCEGEAAALAQPDGGAEAEAAELTESRKDNPVMVACALIVSVAEAESVVAPVALPDEVPLAAGLALRAAVGLGKPLADHATLLVDDAVGEGGAELVGGVHASKPAPSHFHPAPQVTLLVKARTQAGPRGREALGGHQAPESAAKGHAASPSAPPGAAVVCTLLPGVNSVKTRPLAQAAAERLRQRSTGALH